MATYKRINEKTPNGGDYSEIFYLNDKNDPADETVARITANLSLKHLPNNPNQPYSNHDAILHRGIFMPACPA